MFGESDSESPRVPSPWDSLISSSSPSPSPSLRPTTTPPGSNPSPLSISAIPRLVPENDEGNVEYKLQLLDPSPARFARLVTQLKWRLLEGGGQAYYELGVADSGALVGLPRDEMERSLETLEMMAGEIGASVIVVKEIDVPAAMAGIAASQTDTWNGRRRAKLRSLALDDGSEESSTAAPAWTGSTTETETEPSSTTDLDADADLDTEDAEDLSLTIILDKTTSTAPATCHHRVSSSLIQDPDNDDAENADAEPDDSDPSFLTAQTYVSVDLEISTVFKPRPMRARMVHAHTQLLGGKARRVKKIKQQQPQEATVNGDSGDTHLSQSQHHSSGDRAHKALTRRQMRDRKREEKRRALLALASTALPNVAEGTIPKLAGSTGPAPTGADVSALVSDLSGLHVSMEGPASMGTKDREDKDHGIDANEDDVFPEHMTVGSEIASASKGQENAEAEEGEGVLVASVEVAEGGRRLIVEALVVRKMSLDEAFLDFGGFALA